MAGPFDLIAEAKRLVRFNTVTWSSNADCAVHVGSLMRKMGMGVFYQDSRVGDALFMNVAGMAGPGKDPLLLATHLDTVPPGDLKAWTKTGGDPWRLTRKGGSLYGLGAADTKLDLLCKLFALGRLGRGKMERPVIVLGTFGEESGLQGAARFCQGDLPRPKMALVGEPTDLALVTRHKGFAVVEVLFKSHGLYRPSSPEWVYEVSFRGEPSHSSTPQLGKNALDAGIAFLKEAHGKFGKMSLLSWEGGEGHNIIPASCRLRFSLGDRPFSVPGLILAPPRAKVTARRVEPGWYPTLPWEDAVWCVEMVGGLLAPLQRARDKAFQPPHLTWNLTQMKGSPEGWVITLDLRPLPGQSIQKAVKAMEQKLWKRLGPPGSSWQFRLERDNPALEIDSGAPLVKEARAALKAARIGVKVAAKAGCSEAGLYSRVGIPSLVFGPGRSVGNIHRPNESIPVASLGKAVRFYEAFIRRTCL